MYSMYSDVYNKGCGDNDMTQVFTQEYIDNLKPCDLVNPFAMDDARVVVQELMADAVMDPDNNFNNDKLPIILRSVSEAELVNVARAVHLSKNKERFDTIESRAWELLTVEPGSKDRINAEGFISHCIFSKYKVRRADQLAELVHNDFPTQLIDDLFRYLKSKGAKVNKDIWPNKPYKVFTDGTVMIEHLIGWAVHTVSPTAFAHKYAIKKARPEEVIGAWARGEYKVSPVADEALRHYVDVAAVLKDQRSFTMYPEGSPNHPSGPAMHSSLSAMVLLFGVILDLPEDLQEECMRMTCNIADGRTFAGVHYKSDNLYGLELGERVMAEILPEWLGQWGADIDKVKKLIADKRNYWLETT